MMMLRCSGTITTAVLLVSIGWQVFPARGQEAATQDADTAPSDSQRAQRREIFQSERWRSMNRTLNEWLAVQEIYTEDQVADLKVDLNTRTAQMSPGELEALLEEMEARLEVLMSPDAEDARQWLARFFARVRDPEQRLGRSRPDVMNMTASEIREELDWLQQHRTNEQQAQAAFDRARSQRVQSAQQVGAANRQAQESVGATRSRAAATNFRSPYTPFQDRPNFTDFRAIDRSPLRPYYTVGPWGNPIRWHPLRDDWYWYW